MFRTLKCVYTIDIIVFYWPFFTMEENNKGKVTVIASAGSKMMEWAELDYVTEKRR